MQTFTYKGPRFEPTTFLLGGDGPVNCPAVPPFESHKVYICLTFPKAMVRLQVCWLGTCESTPAPLSVVFLNIGYSLSCGSMRQSRSHSPSHTATLIPSDWFPSPLMFSQLKFMGTWGASRYHGALASFSLPFKVLPSLPLQLLKQTLQMLKTSAIRQHSPPPEDHESFSWFPGPLAEDCGHFL